MSFILDALKKAESERNRRVAPVLMDARVAPPRRSLPVWAWALGAVLLVNLGVLAWLLLREPAAQAVPATSPAAITPPPAPATIAPATAPVPSPSASLPAEQATPAAEIGITPGSVVVTPSAPAPAAPVTAPTSTLDPRDLPTLQELRALGVTLPDLQLNLHVYDPAPALRSVLLNGQRLREGDYSPEGIRLERVTPEGAVLEGAGRRFRLDAGN